LNSDGASARLLFWYQLKHTIKCIQHTRKKYLKVKVNRVIMIPEQGLSTGLNQGGKTQGKQLRGPLFFLLFVLKDATKS
jgi:hypothetical protein